VVADRRQVPESRIISVWSRRRSGPIRGGVEAAAKALEVRLRDEARTIRDKYIRAAAHHRLRHPLSADRRPCTLKRCAVRGWPKPCSATSGSALAGPTTLAALLNSLQMGFRTLAIEKRSSEVWAVLGAVKTEFGKFGEALAHTRKKLSADDATGADADGGE
jgi:DNA recombination protein RmuC